MANSLQLKASISHGICTVYYKYILNQLPLHATGFVGKELSDGQPGDFIAIPTEPTFIE
jgi:hypothetical protein